MTVIVDVRTEKSEELVEAVRDRAEFRVIAEVPLAEQGRVIAGALHHLG